MKRFLTGLFLIVFTPVWADTLPEEVFVDEVDESKLNHGEHLVRITFADDEVYLNRNRKQEEPATKDLPVGSGDTLTTEYRSFAEVEFVDGSLMQIGDKTEVEFQAINESYKKESLTVINLSEGSLFLHYNDNDHFKNRLFRIDTRSGSTYIQTPGVYRIDMKLNKMKVKVYRGVTELSGEKDSVLIKSGEYAVIRSLYRPSSPLPFNSFYSDRFERWAYDRRPYGASVSAEYVDGEISYYSRDLDDHGDWRYESDSSQYVWVPRVNASWRPYDNGYWSHRRDRLFWNSHDPFGWVTHHYGRWGWSIDFGWYWYPRSRFAPAWVAWNSYDSYVGWCPLGYRNRPYYYRAGRPHTVIINNHNHYWNYTNAQHIAQGRRVYERPAIRRNQGVRRISTTPLYLTRNDLSSGQRLAEVVRNPAIRRSNFEATRTLSGTIATRNGARGSRSYTQIRGIDTGTRALPRYTTVSRGRTVQTGNRQAVRSREGLATPTRRSTATRSNPSRSSQSRSTLNRGSQSGRTAQPSNRSSRGTTRTQPSNRRAPSRAQTPSHRTTNRNSATRSTTNRSSVNRSTTSRSTAQPSRRSSSSSSRTVRPSSRTNSRSTGSVRSTPSRSSSQRPAVRTQRPVTRKPSAKPTRRPPTRKPSASRPANRPTQRQVSRPPARRPTQARPSTNRNSSTQRRATPPARRSPQKPTATQRKPASNSRNG